MDERLAMADISQAAECTGRRRRARLAHVPLGDADGMSSRRDRRRRTLAAQGAYYLLTGVAPFASRRAFERVTGPKTEWWLVQTTGALVAVAGAGLLSAARRPTPAAELRAMAGGWALSLAAIEIVYVARRRISPVYLLDAAVQTAIVAGLAPTPGDPA
jgi:hypothetical protein